MFGLNFLGPLGLATMGDGRPDNSSGDTSALQKLYAALHAQNHTPNGRVARGFNQFGPQAAPVAAPNTPAPQVPALGGLGLFPPASPMSQSPLQTAQSTPAPLPSPPALSAQAMAPQAPPVPPAASAPAHVLMPTARPDAAPQAPPDMSFFQRNAAMMRDPSSGAFIDPTNAERAQASGPDVINKLLSYFHQKDA